MRQIMDEIVQKYDRDANKTIDYEEFIHIVTDADIDLVFSIY